MSAQDSINREDTMKDRTDNKLNTPYRTNAEYVKKKSKNHGYDYEFGNDVNAKDSALARGANIANAFSYPAAPAIDTANSQGSFRKYNEEYAIGNTDNVSYEREVTPKKLKRKYQDNLRQNYNVEFSDDELISDNCDNCDNCARRKKK